MVAVVVVFCSCGNLVALDVVVVVVAVVVN